MMQNEQTWVLYGAYGYTGTLIARRARQLGLRPILAGRDPDRLAQLATELALPSVVCDLDDPRGLRTLLEGAQLVLNCAGPFEHTYKSMIDACLATGTHYLDITGEIPVFERIAARDADAMAARIMLLPGVGFDIVPSDYLSCYLKTRLPSAQRQVIALKGLAEVSPGTAVTALEYIGRNGKVRRNGSLVEVPLGWKSRSFDFGSGMEPAVIVPWGDVATAYYTTGIGNIEVYAAVPAAVRRAMALLRFGGRLLRRTWIRSLLTAVVRRSVKGPSEKQRADGFAVLYGEARGAGDLGASALLRCPDAYTLTAHVSLNIVSGVLGGRTKPGFQTPFRVFGGDILLDIPGVEIEDLE